MISDKYNDIISLPHHVSHSRPQMPLAARAAQFAPFAALTGHDDAVRETSRLTEEYIDPDEDRLSLLNLRINIINDNIYQKPLVSFRYFIPDSKKSGGSYEQFTGNVRRIDEYQRSILFTDGTVLSIDSIVDIYGKIFTENDMILRQY